MVLSPVDWRMSKAEEHHIVDVQRQARWQHPRSFASQIENNSTQASMASRRTCFSLRRYASFSTSGWRRCALRSSPLAAKGLMGS